MRYEFRKLSRTLRYDLQDTRSSLGNVAPEISSHAGEVRSHGEVQPERLRYGTGSGCLPPFIEPGPRRGRSVGPFEDMESSRFQCGPHGIRRHQKAGAWLS
jgi:hypothetical protein